MRLTLHDDLILVSVTVEYQGREKKSKCRI
jgi:hypothetical protein